MKKILALLLAVVMVLAMAACGSKSDDAAAPAAEAPAAAPAAEAPAAPAAEAPAAAPAAEAPAAPPAGEASGEPSGEASGDPDAEAPPASAAMENTAHGGTPGATSEADYQAYLKAWLDAEKEVNSTMTDDMKGEFLALIDALDFETFPGDMLFNGMLTTGAAMTYDEFVAADGVY